MGHDVSVQCKGPTDRARHVSTHRGAADSTSKNYGLMERREDFTERVRSEKTRRDK